MTFYDYIDDDLPYPVIPIQLSTIDDPGLKHTKYALVDSGGEISCIPSSIVAELGLTPRGNEPVLGVNGVEDLEFYEINLEVNGIPFNNHLVYKYVDLQYLLIGRDIINRFHICLDGINEKTEIR